MDGCGAEGVRTIAIARAAACSTISGVAFPPPKRTTSTSLTNLTKGGARVRLEASAHVLPVRAMPRDADGAAVVERAQRGSKVGEQRQVEPSFQGVILAVRRSDSASVVIAASMEGSVPCTTSGALASSRAASSCFARMNSRAIAIPIATMAPSTSSQTRPSAR